MSVPDTLSLNDLKLLAEAAHGLQGGPLLVLRRKQHQNGEPDFMVVKKGTSVEAGIWEVLVEVNAAYTGNPAYAPRTDPLKLIAPPGKKLVDKDGQDIGDVDAWFLSPAAIEKFVLPYYTITRGAEFAKIFGTATTRTKICRPRARAGFVAV